MLIMGHPQFETQDDVGIGDGLPPIPEWQFDSTALQGDLSDFAYIDDDAVRNVFLRLRRAFRRAQGMPFPNTRIHDLACFVVHRILPPANRAVTSSPMTESMRYAIILYMFIIQGPTYYSHAVILNTIIKQSMGHLQDLGSTPRACDSLDVWLISIGMVASTGTAHYHWFAERAQAVAASLHLRDSNDALALTKSVLWLETLQGEDVFRSHWDAILNVENQPRSQDFLGLVSPNSMSSG